MDFGSLRPALDKLISVLKEIAVNTSKKDFTTTAGTGNVPAGLRAVTIINTDSVDVTITLADGSTYVLKPNEVFSDVATFRLPAYTIAGGTHKWHGIKIKQ